MEKNESGVSLWQKISFALTDIYGGGSFNIVNFLYPAYTALVIGLSGFEAGLLMFLARAWDAISDPLMGQISDRTKNGKFGKRRIYILIGGILILPSMVLMFAPWNFGSKIVLFIAVLLSYMIFSTVQTMIMIPYYSLSSEMTPDYYERTKLNSVRLGFSIFSSIVCVAVPGMIANPENPKSYITMSIIFGLIFAIPVICSAIFTREKIITPPSKEKFSIRSFIKPLKVKPFREYLGLQICLSFTMAIMSGLFFFMIDFVVNADITASGGSSMLGLIAAGLMFGTQIVALPFYLWVVRKTNKKFAYCLGATLWIVVALCILFLKNGTPDWIVYIIAVLMGFGISGPGLIPHTMFGDVADAGELYFGVREEGAFSGLQNFINKIAQALGMLLIMTILGAFDFVSKDLTNGTIPLSQPESAQWAIKIIMAVAPLIIMGAGMIIASRYKITRDKQAEMMKVIEAQRLDPNNEDVKLKRDEVIKTL